jgi:hypothetical protein
MSDLVDIREEQEHWVILMEGWQVTQLRVDAAFGLVFWRSNNAEISIRIGNDFSYNEGEDQYALSPSQPTALGPALALLGQEISAATTTKNGGLYLRFGSAISVSVPPDPQYEAWELSGPKGFLVVCTPGGELSIWGPDLQE